MNRQDYDTDDLVNAAAEGDHAARLELLHRPRQRLTRMVAMRMDPRTRARFDPSDVVQEALIVADQRLSDYLRNRPIAFYPWLRRLTWEQLLKFHERHIQAQKRSIDREAVQALNVNDESICWLAEQLVSNFSNPSERMVRHELRHRIEEALKQLKPKDREVIELLYLEQLKPKEVAEVLGVSQPTVWTRHLRAIRRLTILFEEN